MYINKEQRLVWLPSWALKWSLCLPSCGGWVLVGVAACLGSEVVLSPVVSRCLPLSPFMWRVGGCFYFCLYSMVESNISTMFGCV